LVDGVPMRTIGFAPEGAVEVIDQTRLPHELVLVRWRTAHRGERGPRRVPRHGR
jgi:methylthioribose-1-phosphate isomerase